MPPKPFLFLLFLKTPLRDTERVRSVRSDVVGQETGVKGRVAESEERGFEARKSVGHKQFVSGEIKERIR